MRGGKIQTLHLYDLDMKAMELPSADLGFKSLGKKLVVNFKVSKPSQRRCTVTFGEDRSPTFHLKIPYSELCELTREQDGFCVRFQLKGVHFKSLASFREVLEWSETF